MAADYRAARQGHPSPGRLVPAATSPAPVPASLWPARALPFCTHSQGLLPSTVDNCGRNFPSRHFAHSPFSAALLSTGPAATSSRRPATCPFLGGMTPPLTNIDSIRTNHPTFWTDLKNGHLPQTRTAHRSPARSLPLPRLPLPAAPSRHRRRPQRLYRGAHLQVRRPRARTVGHRHSRGKD